MLLRWLNNRGLMHSSWRAVACQPDAAATDSKKGSQRLCSPSAEGRPVGSMARRGSLMTGISPVTRCLRPGASLRRTRPAYS
jgi:hypothetical protein